MIRSMLLPGLILAAHPAASPAQNITQPQVRVRVAGLDLGTSEGLKILEKRLTRAVRTLCEPDDSTDLRRASDRHHCVHTARLSAATQRTAAIARARRTGAGEAAQ